MTMKHLFIGEDGYAAFVEGSEDSLADIQKMVDGLIEYHPCAKGATGMDCWVNEEGGFREDFYSNLVLTYECGIRLRGPGVISRANGEGETTGLTDEDVKLWRRLIDIEADLVPLDEVCQRKSLIATLAEEAVQQI